MFMLSFMCLPQVLYKSNRASTCISQWNRDFYQYHQEYLVSLIFSYSNFSQNNVYVRVSMCACARLHSLFSSTVIISLAYRFSFFSRCCYRYRCVSISEYQIKRIYLYKNYIFSGFLFKEIILILVTFLYFSLHFFLIKTL